VLACLFTEAPPFGMRSEFLVGQRIGRIDLVCAGMDPGSSRRLPVVGPVGVLLRQREVLAGMGPTLTDELRGCA
jgi:hypothetical protein